MAPRDFATDGAMGATQTGDAVGPKIVKDPASGSGPGPKIMHDPGPLAEPGGPSTSSAPAAPSGAGLGGGYGGFSSPAPSQGAPGALPSSGLSGGFGPFETPGGGGFVSPGTIGGMNSPQLGLMFARGGTVPDVANSYQNDLAAAMNTVDQALAFGRKLHGLPSGDPEGQTKKLAMNTTDFHKSGNIEDRRDNDPTVNEPAGSNFRTNADRVGDKINDIQSSYNPASQDLGINNVKPMAIPYPGDGGPTQGPGPQGADDETPGAGQQQGAIPDDEEAA